MNTVPDDRLPKMTERAAKKKFPFPYLYDPSQETAKAYGANYTALNAVMPAKLILLCIAVFCAASIRVTEPAIGGSPHLGYRSVLMWSSGTIDQSGLTARILGAVWPGHR